MADNMMRIAGRDKSTGTAKAINTESGNLVVNLEKSRTEIIKYTKTNLPTSFHSPDFFEPRDTANKVLFLDHANIGIFEQSIGIRNTLGVDVTLAVKVLVDGGDGEKTGGTILSVTVPTDSRIYLISDKSLSTIEIANNKIIPVVELRLPYPKFVIDIKASSAPISGSLGLQITRRY